ncbi:unnamed protein product, partial [Effrenium voratum]
LLWLRALRSDPRAAMPVIEGLGKRPTVAVDASFADSLGESPAKVGHVASLVESWQKSPQSANPVRRSTRRSGEDGDSPESPVAELADKLERLEARLDRLVGSVELLNQRLERQAAPPEVAETLARRSVEEVNLKMRLEALELQLCRDLVLQNSALELCQAQLTELRELARPREVDGARPPAAPDAAIAEAVAPLVAREVRRAVRAEYGRLVLGLADTSALPSGAELRSPSAQSNLVAPLTSEDFAEAAPS